MLWLYAHIVGAAVILFLEYTVKVAGVFVTDFAGHLFYAQVCIP